MTNLTDEEKLKQLPSQELASAAAVIIDDIRNGGYDPGEAMTIITLALAGIYKLCFEAHYPPEEFAKNFSKNFTLVARPEMMDCVAVPTDRSKMQ